jgi:hypothetical protein
MSEMQLHPVFPTPMSSTEERSRVLRLPRTCSKRENIYKIARLIAKAFGKQI